MHLLAAARAAARLAGRGVRDARRRRRDGGARAARTASCCGPRPSSSASRRRRPWRPRSRRSRCRGDADAARRRPLLALCAAGAVARRLAGRGRARDARSRLRPRWTRCARGALPRVERDAPARRRARRARAPLGVKRARRGLRARAPGAAGRPHARAAGGGRRPRGPSSSRCVAAATSCPPVGVRATGPLGLGAWYHRLGGDAEVLVYPDLVGARRLALAARRGQLPESGRRARGSPSASARRSRRCASTRPTTTCARSTGARRRGWGARCRNQYRIDQDREVRCLLDAGRLSAAACAGGTLLDVALDGLVAVVRDRRRARRPQRRSRVRRPRAARRRALAPRRRRRRARALRRRAGRRRQRLRARVPHASPAASEASCSCSPTSSTRRRRARSSSAVPVLARRHAVCVASVRDDALDALARRGSRPTCATPTP